MLLTKGQQPSLRATLDEIFKSAIVGVILFVICRWGEKFDSIGANLYYAALLEVVVFGYLVEAVTPVLVGVPVLRFLVEKEMQVNLPPSATDHSYGHYSRRRWAYGTL